MQDPNADDDGTVDEGEAAAQPVVPRVVHDGTGTLPVTDVTDETAASRSRLNTKLEAVDAALAVARTERDAANEKVKGLVKEKEQLRRGVASLDRILNPQPRKPRTADQPALGSGEGEGGDGS